MSQLSCMFCWLHQDSATNIPSDESGVLVGSPSPVVDSTLTKLATDGALIAKTLWTDELSLFSWSAERKVCRSAE